MPRSAYTTSYADTAIPVHVSQTETTQPIWRPAVPLMRLISYPIAAELSSCTESLH
jgi:hypothetical protein